MDVERAGLPAIRSSQLDFDQKKALPTSLQSDFIPEDILLAITYPPPAYNKLGPPTRYRNLDTSTANKKVPANVWNYPQRRDKFKHLMKNTPCICGAGKDISFLYDVPKKVEKSEKTTGHDPSCARLRETSQDTPKKPLTLPDTLIPDEYHLVKNKGVMGLEYHDDKFVTVPEDHEKHLVQFPSMYPTSRFEVTQLKKTLNEMLERAGIYEEAVEVKGPTQMHNLLELIKKEQNIYNIVFHELIRQSSVECLERGELLAELREKYSMLFNKVPRQIKGLHEEVLAQRALDRRLTEELLRFKTTISALTSELISVKEHDAEVTEQAQYAQEQLNAALTESRKNANLLTEYHDLYDLQRKRLEKQVDLLADEREIWSTVAYSLALKVMEEHSLNTCKRLHISEKAWCKLAHHFTILLSDSDTVILTSLQGYMEKWQQLIEKFNDILCQREADMSCEMNRICTALRFWSKQFQSNLNADGYLEKIPDAQQVAQLHSDLKTWQQTMSQESEKFGGDTVLTGQEYMSTIRHQVYGWTDCAMKIFTRHQTNEALVSADQNDMQVLNEEVYKLLAQCQVRLTGENGVAAGIISINNSLDYWDGRLLAVVTGAAQLQDPEWLRLYHLLDEWAVALGGTIACVGTTQKHEQKQEMTPHTEVTVTHMMKLANKWMTSTVNSIDSEDAKLVENVGNLHTEQIKWMVQMLLHLAPDQENHSQEAKESILLGSSTIGQLQSNAKSIFGRLSSFTNYVARCCKGIVMDDLQQKLDQRQENADMEQKALSRLMMECSEWINVARMMLTELTGEPFPDSHLYNVTDIFLDSKHSTTDDMLPVSPVYHDKEMLIDTQSVVGQNDLSADKHRDVQEITEASSAVEPTEVNSSSLQDKVKSEAEVNTEVLTEVREQGTETSGQPSEPEPAEDNQIQSTDDSIEIIGHDANTHKAALAQCPNKEPSQLTASAASRNSAAAPDTHKAYEALAALETLQLQLIATEERAQGAESKVATMEQQLKAAEERIRSLERQYVVIHESTDTTVIEPLQQSAPSLVVPSSTPAPPKKVGSSTSRASNKQKKK